MTKLNLVKLNFENADLIKREDLKSIVGGYRDGFDCAAVYAHCDGFPDFNSFETCMGSRGC